MAARDQPTTTVPPSQPCSSCGSPMAADQRYCLDCGARRGEPRAAPVATAGVEPPAPAPPPVSQRPADVSPLAAVIGIALLGGMLLIGVLIGRSGSNDEPAPAPIVQLGDQTTPATPATPTTPTTPEPAPAPAVATDWPSDAEGFTVKLNALPKDGATQETVDAAKQAATSNGAKNVGVLDADLYPGLTAGNYVVYSGIFSTRKEAESHQATLRKAFPDASVIEVKTDDKTVTPGLSPPDGESAPGGGAVPDGASGGASVGGSADRAPNSPEDAEK